MMRVFVRVRLSDLSTVELAPEAVIGRMRSATLRLNDPSISEAHAMVSLRGSVLKLLALRGRFMVDGAPQSEVVLREGQRIELGARVLLDVLTVSIPPEVLALRAEGLPLQALPPVASIVAGSPEVVPGFQPNAEATLWLDGELVHVRRPGCEDEAFACDEAVDIAGRTYLVERMSLRDLDAPATARQAPSTPLVLTLRYDSVHIASGEEVAAIDGVPARILCELAEFGGPVEWRTIAREIWPREDDEGLLRRNWDAGLARLRKSLHEQGVRANLVRAAGRGRMELFLQPRDRVEDRQ